MAHEMDEEIHTEVDLLIRVSHLSNVCKYFDRFRLDKVHNSDSDPESDSESDSSDEDTKQDPTYCIMLEFVDGQDLRAYIRSGEPVSDEVVVGFFQSGLEALAAMHHELIVHRDVTPVNFVVASNRHVHAVDSKENTSCSCLPRLVLIDLGLGTILPQKGDLPQEDVGTPNYYSPDLIRVAQGTAVLTREVLCANDVWGLGATMYYLCTGTEIARHYGHSDRGWDKAWAEVLRFKPKPVIHSNPQLAAMILSCLNPNFRHRPTAQQLLDQLLVIKRRLLPATSRHFPIKSRLHRYTLHGPKGISHGNSIYRNTRKNNDLERKRDIHRTNSILQELQTCGQSKPNPENTNETNSTNTNRCPVRSETKAAPTGPSSKTKQTQKKTSTSKKKTKRNKELQDLQEAWLNLPQADIRPEELEHRTTRSGRDLSNRAGQSLGKASKKAKRKQPSRDRKTEETTPTLKTQTTGRTSKRQRKTTSFFGFSSDHTLHNTPAKNKGKLR